MHRIQNNFTCYSNDVFWACVPNIAGLWQLLYVLEQLVLGLSKNQLSELAGSSSSTLIRDKSVQKYFKTKKIQLTCGIMNWAPACQMIFSFVSFCHELE